MAMSSDMHAIYSSTCLPYPLVFHDTRLLKSYLSSSDPTNFPEQRSKVFSSRLSKAIDAQLQAMEEHETEPDVPCLVCYDLRFPKESWDVPDWLKRQRKLARELSGYNPFNEVGALFVEAKSLDATAAAGCLSCALLRDIWGRLCHTEELCSGEGDMEGRHGFFLHHYLYSQSDFSELPGPFLRLKDHIYVIHTMEGTVAMYSHARAQNRLKTNDKTNPRRILPLECNILSILELLLTNIGSSAAVCRRCIP